MIMELSGRLTADAKVKELSEGRKVVNFNIAINNGYSKNGVWVDKVVFVECAYWLNRGVAEFLTKGRRVELFGQIGVNAYLNASNEAIGKLTFHVKSIKLDEKPKSPKTGKSTEPILKAEAVTGEDLPF
jgi:single-strand DNA-binding protein